MKWLGALVLLTLAGCGSFGQGLRDGFEASLRDSVVSSVSAVVADKVEKKDAALAEAIRNLPSQLPKPAPPTEPKDNTVQYGLAFLIAKLLGDGVGGLVRSKVGRKDA